MKRLVTVGLALFMSAALYASDSECECSPVDIGPVDTEGFESVTNAGVTVSWMVKGSDLSVVISARTTGWVAVGFDPSRMMGDANIIIGYVMDGQVFVRDDFGVGNIRHGADSANGGVDNLADITGSEEGGVTTIGFTIPLDSGDGMDKPLVAGRTYRIIMAYGPDGADDFSTHHASRGSTEIRL